MSKVQRGVVPVPNEMHKGNRANSSGPLTRNAPATHAPNANIHDGDTNNGFLPLTRSHGVVNGSNNTTRFNVEHARDGFDDPPVAEPGKGAVPVNPFRDSGGPNTVGVPLRDTAKRGK